ncbi:hypothetical protein PHMEG_000600 [Phytophthora megakarya]|uniref:Uncharacterized protein n=1 Tax=Phytophthora megakarya TaxID=4795 RepID=A0A225X2L1_9STRA|nr:hypothetical protein PHMEG_000600 [Phytophthora megakarya]
MRHKVKAARRGVQTERSERPSDKRIAAVRRRGGLQEEKGDGRRRMGRREAEWIERQLQYKTRVATLEKECHAAWQTFFAAGTCSSFVSTAEVNKLFEEMETMRTQDVNTIRHQLIKLNSKVHDVQVKVEEIENGDQFFSELQERIDVVEAAIAKFRLSQRQQFEEFVLEEKLLEKELAGFIEKMEGWDRETPRLSRGGASAPRLTHLGSKSRLRMEHNVSRCPGSNEVICNNQDEDRSLRTGTPDELGMVDRVRRLNDAILQTGGLKDGWDSREHATFTTLLIKGGLTDDMLLQHAVLAEPKVHPLQLSASRLRSNQEELPQSENWDYETRVARFLRKCMRKIVTQTENSVRSHFEWYLRHLELVEEKKRVIQEWKIKKEEEREQIIQCGFDANGEVTGNVDNETSRDSPSNQQTSKVKLKAREKTERLLEQWKLDKKQKEEERQQRRREIQRKREAVEAKTSKEDLVERSRIAIEYAKAKRLRLQQIEERRQKQQRLPPRPEPKTGDESANSSAKALVLNPTEASKARDFSKDELRKQARRRERQSAHDAYIPGKKALPDVRFKSFGHIPIQPRAVPAWRKNI